MVDADTVLIKLRDKLLELLKTYIDKKHLENNKQFVFNIYHADSAAMLLFCDEILPYANVNQLDGYFLNLLNSFNIDKVHPDLMPRLLKLANCLIDVKKEVEKSK